MLRSPVREIINYRPPAASPASNASVPQPAGDYIITSTRIQIATVVRPATQLTIVSSRRPSTFALARLALPKHDRTAKHRNRNFFA